jgi:hypothetical protein
VRHRSRRTIATIEWTCDLCGKVRHEDALRRLYGQPGNKPGQRPQVDICGDCMTKPVSAVFKALAAREKADRPVRVAPSKRANL